MWNKIRNYVVFGGLGVLVFTIIAVMINISQNGLPWTKDETSLQSQIKQIDADYDEIHRIVLKYATPDQLVEIYGADKAIQISRKELNDEMDRHNKAMAITRMMGNVIGINETSATMSDNENSTDASTIDSGPSEQ